MKTPWFSALLISLIVTSINSAWAPSIEDYPTCIKKHIISIELFPSSHQMKAEDNMIVFSEGSSLRFFINKTFAIDSVTIDNKETNYSFTDFPEDLKPKKIDDDNVASDFKNAILLTIKDISSGQHSVSIKYTGTLYDIPKASEFSREYVANQTSGIISQEGVFLSPDSFWYPQGDEDMTFFEIQTKTPIGFESITQGTRIKREIEENRVFTHWKNIHPSDLIYLQAGPYQIQEDTIDGIDVYTYFFKGGDQLSSLYLQKSKDYISMYNQLLGKYPYDKFAVVENFFETGYGMPSWTLLGKTVVRLPFIPDTSLPHEICHNWWGNGVFVDYSEGNWCEGLTVYCADYLLKKRNEEKGDIDYRRQINRDYSSYVKDHNDFPLSEFRSRYNPASRALGYGKAMMVFHDLQRRVGEDKFFEGLRKIMEDNCFQKISWTDILGAYENNPDFNCSQFYEQWIVSAGAPLLKIADVSSHNTPDGSLLTFKIIQTNKVYKLNVPVFIDHEQGRIVHILKLEESIQMFDIIIPSSPRRIEIDPEHQIFRQLYPEEIPPSIAKVFGSEKQIIITSSNIETSEIIDKAAGMLNKTKSAVIKQAANILPEDINKSSVIILGDWKANEILSEFVHGIFKTPPWDQKTADSESAGYVLVFDHPENLEFAVMLIRGNPKSDLLSVVRKMPHYGKYSYLLFQGENNVAKGIWPVESTPLIYTFEKMN